MKHWSLYSLHWAGTELVVFTASQRGFVFANPGAGMEVGWWVNFNCEPLFAFLILLGFCSKHVRTLSLQGFHQHVMLF